MRLERRSLARVAGLTLLVALGYAETLRHPFVYDDRTVILGNPSIRSLSSLRALIAHDIKRPLVNLSYALDWAFSGAEPTAYHVTNLLIHLINALLLFWVARALAEDRHRGLRGADEDGAWFAAALFAVHPMMTESVGYTSARSGMLATTFVLASLLLIRRGLVEKRRRLVGAGIGVWVLGLMCKETAAALPLIVWAWDALFLDGSAEEKRRRQLRLHLPLTALLLAGGIARLVLHLRAEQSGVRPFDAQLWTQLCVMWRYLGLFLWPASQSIAHSVHTARSPLEGEVVLAIAGLAVAAALAWRWRRKAPQLAFGLLWFVLLLAPSSLVPLAEQMSEHRTYEASPGLFLIAGAALAAVAEKLRDSTSARARLLRGLPVVLVAACLFLTVARNRVWADPIQLWTDGVANAPDLWTAHYALANEYQHAGRCADALPEYNATVQLRPTQRAVINTGACLAQLGRYDEAERLFLTAAQMGPAVDPEINLGLLDAARGRPESARDHLRRAIELDPDQILARQALVNLDDTVFHDREDALKLCREVARIAPGTEGVEACLRR
jgi:tetratricopeptide (TPR) repeat protein